MPHTLRPTPTCTRFPASIEMPCIKCAEPMRLALIEPRRRAFDLLTYHCNRCDSEESFLTALKAGDASQELTCTARTDRAGPQYR
jgi:hypothetical protein